VKILVAKASAVFRTPDGELVRLKRGRTTVEAGHPILRGREHFFEPLVPTFRLPKKPAASSSSSSSSSAASKKPAPSSPAKES